MTIIKYETPIRGTRKFPGPIIFLAGPTVRQNQPHLVSWRFEAIEQFRKFEFEGTLLIPEMEDWNNLGNVGLTGYDFPEWELEGLSISDCIMFWIPRTEELIGLTTNFEMGYWLAKDPDRIVYGKPDGAYRTSYNDFMWKKSIGRPIQNTLENTVRFSIINSYSQFY